jgi:outer membrane protein, heavy metal efflux system
MRHQLPVLPGVRWVVPLLIALHATVGSLAAAQDAPQGVATLTLSGALERAMASNPAIIAARLQRPADLAGVDVAAERPNPEVNYELSKETPRQAIGGSVPIELGGKRDRRIELARATLAVTDAELQRLVAEVRNDVRRAYFETVAAALRVEIVSDVTELARRARDAANARVVAGEVPRSDLTQADLTLATSESELIAAEGEAAATRAELNALIGQAADTPFAPGDSLSTAALPSPQAAMALATASNAELRALDRRIDEQTARVRLARALTTPDVSAGGALTYDAEPEFRVGWRVGAAVTIPVFTRHRAGVVVEEATLARLHAERRAVAARLDGGIAASVRRATAAREQLTRYETTILPLALEAERQAQAAYTGGQIGLPALVQALQTARDTRQRGLQAGLDYQHALADLERVIGAPLQ